MQVGGASFACTVRDRLVGLFRAGDGGGVLVLAPCRDVHTFGMRADIDVAFVASDGTVLESHRAVRPGRRMRCRNAVVTLERVAGGGAWFSPGDSVLLAIGRHSEAGEEESKA